jgi:hypothetical protein
VNCPGRLHQFPKESLNEWWWGDTVSVFSGDAYWNLIKKINLAKTKGISCDDMGRFHVIIHYLSVCRKEVDSNYPIYKNALAIFNFRHLF